MLQCIEQSIAHFRKEQLIMDQTKIQDIVRHITKDEDYGVGMMEKLTLADAVEVMTQMLPTLKKRAKEQGNSNDLAYFNRIENIYAKVMADKLRNEEHLWVVYCNTTAYPYMIDDDIMVLYNNKNASLLEKKLKLSGCSPSSRTLCYLAVKPQVPFASLSSPAVMDIRRLRRRSDKRESRARRCFPKMIIN